MKKQKASQQKNLSELTSSVDLAALEHSLPDKSVRSHHVAIRLSKVHKHFGSGASKVTVLRNVSCSIYSGEFVIISGPSGSGKSTILHTMLGLEEPSSGSVRLRGEHIYKLSTTERTKFRREKIGMVFQQSNWIKSLSVWENVAYPLWLTMISPQMARERAFAVLESVGLTSDLAEKVPTELSGGQQQRASLARALITDPGIIIADEPTGNLDTNSGTEVIRLLADLNRTQRKIIVMVTHDTQFLPIANRKILVKDGSIVYDTHD